MDCIHALSAFAANQLSLDHSLQALPLLSFYCYCCCCCCCCYYYY